MKSTLAIYDAMLEAKVPASAARGVAEALEKDMEANLATKSDLNALRGEFQTLRSDLLAKFESLEASVSHRILTLDAKIERMELRMTVKLGSLLIIGIGALAAVIKLS